MQIRTKSQEECNQNSYVALLIKQGNPNNQYNHQEGRSDLKFRSIIENYQRENEQIDQANKQLLEKVQEIQHKENILIDEIRILEAQFQNMKNFMVNNKENSKIKKISQTDSKIITQSNTYFGGSAQSFTD